jgi:hypothetical protein
MGTARAAASDGGTSPLPPTYPLSSCLQFCEYGSLTQVLIHAKQDPAAAAQLTWARRLSFALDAARGMRCGLAALAHLARTWQAHKLLHFHYLRFAGTFTGAHLPSSTGAPAGLMRVRLAH